jgi:hypothetical protein
MIRAHRVLGRGDARIPLQSDLLNWVRENPAAADKREVARASGIKGADRCRHGRAHLALPARRHGGEVAIGVRP